MPQRPQPTASTAFVRGYALRVWEWAPDTPASDATVVLIHATGFHSRTWDAVVAQLPPDWRIFALDMRGHGASQAPPDQAGANWREMAADLIAWLQQRDLRGVAVGGHSMGGCVAVIAAANTDRIAGLTLVDPVLVQPGDEATASLSLPPGGLAVAARKRRREWPSPQAMAQSLDGRGAFIGWTPGLLDSYCRYGLVPNGAAGDWRLACEPAVEAWCFEYASQVNPWPELGRVQQPTILLKAGAAGHPSPTGANAIDVLLNAEQRIVADSDHFIPMKRPDAVADALIESVARAPD